MKNVYYHPEEHGLTVVAELEHSDLCYQFDTRVVWRHSSGQFYTARDSGCSCPEQFGTYRDITSLEELKDFSQIESDMKEEYSVASQEDREAFRRIVTEALAPQTSSAEESESDGR